MRRDLPISELEAFLAEPLLATLATVRTDGFPLLSPVWHEWREGGFNVVVGADDIKARSLRRDPRASLVVSQQVPPYAGVEIRTEARLSPDGALELIRRLAVRYLGEELGTMYADSTADDAQLLVRLEPGRLRTWDFSDDWGMLPPA